MCWGSLNKYISNVVVVGDCTFKKKLVAIINYRNLVPLQSKFGGLGDFIPGGPFVQPVAKVC